MSPQKKLFYKCLQGDRVSLLCGIITELVASLHLSLVVQQKCKINVYPTSLVESVMQYKCPDPSIPAIRWDWVNEERTFKEYEAFMLENHVNFTD